MNLLLRAKYSFYSTLVFLVCANPETYKIMNRIFSPLFGTLASPEGCPTPLGLIGNTLLFFLVFLALLMFPRT
jgi:hypothetical protein